MSKKWLLFDVFSVLVGLLVAAGGGFLIKLAWTNYSDYYAGYPWEHVDYLQDVVWPTVGAFFVFVAAGLIAAPLRFYKNRCIRVMGEACGALFLFAGLLGICVVLGFWWDEVAEAGDSPGPLLLGPVFVCIAATVLLVKSSKGRANSQG